MVGYLLALQPENPLRLKHLFLPQKGVSSAQLARFPTLGYWRDSKGSSLGKPRAMIIGEQIGKKVTARPPNQADLQEASSQLKKLKDYLISEKASR